MTNRAVVAVLGFVSFASSVARADQCAAITAEQGSRALQLVRPGSLVVSYCEPCGEKQPGAAVAVKTAGVRPWSGGHGEVEFLLDGQPTDLAYIFFQTPSGQFANLASAAGCPTTGTSATLPAQAPAATSSTSQKLPAWLAAMENTTEGCPTVTLNFLKSLLTKWKAIEKVADEAKRNARLKRDEGRRIKTALREVRADAGHIAHLFQAVREQNVVELGEKLEAALAVLDHVESDGDWDDTLGAFETVTSSINIFVLGCKAKRTEPVVLRQGETIMLAAEPGMTAENTLGMGFDQTMSALNRRRVFASHFAERPMEDYTATFKRVDNSFQLSAHGNYLFAKAGVDKSTNKRFMVLSVLTKNRVASLATDGSPQADLPLVATKLYYGWAIYYVFEGDESVFTADLSLQLPTWGASLRSNSIKAKLETKTHLIGLSPRVAGDAPIVTDLEDIKSKFQTASTPQPILVEYTAMRDIRGAIIPWGSSLLRKGKYKVVAEIEIQTEDERGSGWYSAGQPNLITNIGLNGSVLATCTSKRTYRATCEATTDLDDSSSVDVNISLMPGIITNGRLIGASNPIRPVGTATNSVAQVLTTAGQIKRASLTFEPAH